MPYLRSQLRKRAKSPSSGILDSDFDFCHDNKVLLKEIEEQHQSDDESDSSESFYDSSNCNDNELLAEEVHDGSDESENSDDEEHVDLDDLPLSKRYKIFMGDLIFVENTNLTPQIHPFTDQFTGLQESCDLDANSSCLDVFKMLIGDEFMEMIAEQSNIYKDQKTDELRKSNKLKPNSRILKCDDVCIDEMYTFHALVILMGIVKKPSIENVLVRNEYHRLLFSQNV